MFQLRILSVALFAMMAAVAAGAGEVVVSDDGRQVQLNDDGSWVYLQKNRYATAADGRRIQLSPHGRWRVLSAGESQVAHRQPASDNEQTNLLAPSIAVRLTSVEIQRRKTRSLKSTRIDTRTVYHLQIENQGEQRLTLEKEQAKALKASSSKGDTFKFHAVNFSRDSIRPGEQGSAALVYRGSPTWLGVRYLRLEIPVGVLGQQQTVYLDREMDDVVVRTVTTFEPQ